MSNVLSRFALMLFAAAILGGCASGVSRHSETAAPQRAGGERIADVSVRLSPEAQAKVADNPGFSTSDLAARIRAHLQTRGALDATSASVLDVSVSDFRVRSTFAAVMFGFLAGNDSLTGAVQVRRPQGETAPFTVSASYALGGLAGGQDGSRMGWLYDEFARLVVTELYGEANPK